MCKTFGSFRNNTYLCHRLQNDGNPSVRAHVSRSAFLAWAFFMPIAHPYNGCLLVKLFCPRVRHRFVSNGKCSRFSVSPCRRGSPAAYKTMQYATVNSDWAGSALDAFQCFKYCKELQSVA